MENEETKRIDETRIGIIDGIKFTVTLLLAFLMDNEKPIIVKH